MLPVELESIKHLPDHIEMPAPPPPPPPMGSSGPPPVFKPPKNSNDRDALLKSIQKGAKLKKAITIDKSAPMIGGVSKNSSSSRNNFTNNSISPNNIASNNAVSPTRNFGSIQMELKKQLASVNENRNRGPPPPAPSRNLSAIHTAPRQPFIQKENAPNGLHSSQSNLNSTSNLSINSSTLHRKAKSNANLTSLQINDDKNGFQSNKLVASHGKPNLAPKPPVLNGKPNNLQPKNGKPVSRAHSLKSPRSPSPQSPDSSPMNKFGTVRHMSSMISQSLENYSKQNSRSRPALNGRPSAPPPSVPVHQPPPPPISHPPSPSQQPPPPPKVSSVRHPSQAPPPPPPPVSTIPQAPSHAPPPPPPHKTQIHKLPAVPPMSNNLNPPPPPPPPRHSSMRDAASVTTVNLDEKFKDFFKPPNQFPQPPPYKNVIKIYNCKPAPIIDSSFVI